MRVQPSLLLSSLCLLISQEIYAADAVWQRLNSPVTAELRGLSVVSSSVAWASGAQGTVLRTTDGEHWEKIAVPGAEKLDFRAIKAFSDQIAWIMSAGPGDSSRIFLTRDGGQHWEQRFVNTDPKGFWNAITVTTEGILTVFGDPDSNGLQFWQTNAQGQSLQRLPASDALLPLENEGAFAASGTCLFQLNPQHLWAVTGGAVRARIARSTDGGQRWEMHDLPLAAGAASRGAFSVSFRDPLHGVVAGGDYKEIHYDSANLALTSDGGKNWQSIRALPAGFLSVVTHIPGTRQTVVAGGLTGSGVSRDDGLHWKQLDTTPVNTIAFADAQHGWAIGPKGLLLRYRGPALDTQSDSK